MSTPDSSVEAGEKETPSLLEHLPALFSVMAPTVILAVFLVFNVPQRLAVLAANGNFLPVTIVGASVALMLASVVVAVATGALRASIAALVAAVHERRNGD